MSRLERINYGTSYKYFPNPSLALGSYRHRQQPTEKEEFSLLNFNPHRSTLGLQAQDFTPSRLCASLQSADAAATAAADAADHQLLDSKTPAASTAFTAAANEDEDEDANTLSDNAVGDDAAAAEAAEEDEPAAVGSRQAAADGPEIQFVLGESSSGSESDDEAGSSDEENDKPDFQSSKPQAQSRSPANQQQQQQQQQVIGQAAQEQQQQQQQVRRKRKRLSEGLAKVHSSGSSSDEGGSSSGSESDTEGDDDDDDDQEEELMLVENDQPTAAAAAAGEEQSESADDFLPLLPSNKAADASDQDHDHNDHDGASADQGKSTDRLPGYKPPWLPRLARFSSPMLRLHNEIVAFTKMLEPTPEEVDSRAKSMKVIRDVVHSIWPQAEVLIFGSYETGLYTPASDTDIVVVNAGLNNPITGLKALAHALTQRQLVRNMQQVLTARVPIIKFEIVASGLAFDVAWEQRSGPAGAAVVQTLLAQWPVMKPLVLVLKVFLTQRELNEVYSGGIGSYSLIIMVAAFLQLHASRRPKSTKSSAGSKRGRSSSGGVQVASAIEANLGLLLLDFFRLYGRALNLSEVGVSCSSEGFFYSKAAKGFAVPDRPWLLSVQDPLDSQNDTARNSWNIKLVRQVFDHAYQLLVAPCSPADSLLGRIIHLAPVVSGRPTPSWIFEAPQAQLGFSHRGDRSRPQKPSRIQNPSRTPSGYRESERDRGGREKSERSRSRGPGSSGKGPGSSSKRGGSSGKGGGSSSRHDDRSRDSSKKQRKEDREGKGGSSSSSKKRRSSNDFAAAGAAGLRLDRGRDAAGRAGGAAAGAGRQQYQQQQQQQQGSRESPSRKRQRR